MTPSTLSQSLALVALAPAILLFGSGAAFGAAVVDDFDDMNDTGWTQFTLVTNSACTASMVPYLCFTGSTTGTCTGVFDASTQEYSISVGATGTPALRFRGRAHVTVSQEPGYLGD
jgi:hypothetical protein